MHDLDDKVSLDTLSNDGFCKVILLDPDLMFCHIDSVILWYGFRAIDDAPHFASLECIFHSN